MFQDYQEQKEKKEVQVGLAQLEDRDSKVTKGLKECL